MDRIKLKNFVKSQLPEFVRNDHQAFVYFLEAFYEWLESNPEKVRVSSQMKDFFDVDETLEVFVDDFKKTYVNSFPINLVINTETGERLNTRTLIKNIRNFYKAKGTPSTYRFLFKILFDSDIEIYYPKNFIFKLSDGVWNAEKKMYISPRFSFLDERSDSSTINGKVVCQRLNSLVENPVIGTAKVVSSNTFIKNGIYVTELDLDEIYGTFSENELLFDFDTSEVIGKVFPVLRDISVTNRGKGYKKNQSINFVELSNSLRIPKAIIQRVSPDIGENGSGVLEIFIRDPGLGITAGSIAISSEEPIDQGGATGGTGFEANLIFGSIFEKRESYIGSRGIINSSMVLQDNRKYQDYSYVIKSDVTISRFRNIVRELIHPAGMEMFSEALISRCFSGDLNAFVNIPSRKTKRIGNYLPYTFLTFDNLGKWFNGACYATGTHDSLIICGVDDCVTGNPISSGVTFEQANSNDCIDSNVLEGAGDYWVTFSHPNIRIRSASTLIYKSQLLDFYGPTGNGNGQSSSGWQEWNLSLGNEGTTSLQESWLQETLNNEEDYNFVTLLFTQGSSFRKIPIYAFIAENECTYDCRYSNGCVEPSSTPLELADFSGTILTTGTSPEETQ